MTAPDPVGEEAARRSRRRLASMTSADLYPLTLKPLFQYRLWGGRALGTWMGMRLPGEGPIGEAWILSDRPEFASQVAAGPLRGETITDVLARFQPGVMGRFAGRFARFPILLKFLDVEKMLSVQVHPRDDQHALIPPGDSGKTEAWVVLGAKPKGRIYAGLKPGTTGQDLRDLSNATVDQHLASIHPKLGDGVLIEAGTVHSLGDGMMVFEVQENSDVTFRLYDWDHVDDKTGKPRPLQVDQALACIDLDQGPIKPTPPVVEQAGSVQRERLFDTGHFRVHRIETAGRCTVGAANEPRVLVCIDGAGAIEGERPVPMKRGAVVLLPAVVGERQFRPEHQVTLLEIAIPEPA